MKRKVLIIDDEKDLCDILVDILKEEGFLAFSSTNGRSGLKMVKEKKTDLVISDIKMPGMDGIEILKRIRKIDKNITVVMITGYGTPDTYRKSIELGAHSCVAKPFDIDLIKEVVKNALQI